MMWVDGIKTSIAADFRIDDHPDYESIDPDKMELLPTTAEFFYGNKLEKFGWDGTLKVILAGTRDRNKNSPLSSLRDHEATIVREIYSYISNQWASHVKLTIPAALVGGMNNGSFMQFNHGRPGRDPFGEYISRYPTPLLRI
jgi:hypothetical protein